MPDRKALEEDFRMYQGAINDLLENGGNNQAIKELEQKKNLTAQVLNLMPRTIVKEDSHFFSF